MYGHRQPIRLHLIKPEHPLPLARRYTPDRSAAPVSLKWGESDTRKYFSSMILGGGFDLFSPADEPATKYMIYELAFEHLNHRYHLTGKKLLAMIPYLTCGTIRQRVIRCYTKEGMHRARLLEQVY